MLKAEVQASKPINSFDDVRSQAAYQALDARTQYAVAMEYFEDRAAKNPEYKKLAPEAQEASKQDFISHYQIPMPDRQPITTGQGFQHKARPMVGFPAGVAGGPAAPAIQVSSPEAAQQIQRTTGQGAALALNDIAKGASFGYGDINKLTGDPLKREAFLKQNPAYGPVLQGSEFAGALLPIEATANLANRGLGQLETAGQRLAISQNVPRYLQGIAEKSVPYLRNIGKEIGKIGPIGRSMLEQGLGFGLYESAKAREGADQFDPMGRAISGIEGAAIGALGAGALGLLGKGAGAVYGQLKNIFLGKVLQGQVQKTGEASVKYLESTAQDLQNLLEDIFANNAQGKLSNKSIKKLSTVKERMGRAAIGEINLTTAEVRSHRSALNQIRREVKAGVKAEGRELKPAAQVTQAEKELQAKTAPIVAQVEVSKKEAQRLQAEIAKLEEQLAKTPEAAAEIEVTERKLTAQVEKQVKAIREKYAKRKQEVKQKPFNSRGSVYDSKEKQLQELGIRESAEVRQAIQGDSLEDLSDVGGLTKTELQAVIKKEASNYQGKAVIVEGKPATVVQPAFGKVKVKFKDGTEKTVAKEAVIPAIKPTPKPTVQEVKVKKPNPEAQAQIEKRKALEAQIEKRQQALAETEAKTIEAEKQLAEAAKTPEPQAQPSEPLPEPIKGTVAIDVEKGIYLQKEIDPKALTYEQVADKIQNKAVGEKLANAMKAGESVRVEYKAEITGRTDKAVTVTAKGNIKEATTTFTPAYFKETKNGKIMVQGYNEQGHFRSYHLDDAESGSVIVKVGKQIPEAFRGEYPNIYKGQREFNINDLTARVEAREGVLTSEAMNNAKLLKDFTTGEAFTKLPKPVQSIMKGIQKRGRFTKSELAALQKELNKDLKQLEEVCQIMGIK